MLQHLRRSYHVLAAAAEAGRPIDKVRPCERSFALILGSEEAGLPRATLDACDEVVTIHGPGLIQSLNVAPRRRFSCMLSRDKG
jgi:RNA methyltransferase, TrmH family